MDAARRPGERPKRLEARSSASSSTWRVSGSSSVRDARGSVYGAGDFEPEATLDIAPFTALDSAGRSR
jgi:hypothetical protein